MPINISERCSIEMQFLISTDKIIYKKNRSIYIINMSIKICHHIKLVCNSQSLFILSFQDGWSS